MIVQQACENQPDKGAELLARMSTSAPAVVREKTTQAKCLELIGACLNHSEPASLHQGLRAFSAILTELDESNQNAANVVVQVKSKPKKIQKNKNEIKEECIKHP